MSTDHNRERCVTVVIPVYKDWETLKRCIESLKKYLNTKHKVILVNDKGPNWKDLEYHILNSIEGFDNFFYEKNECNLGFVKTCNKAVFEIDKSGNDILLLNSDTEVTEGFLEEMQEILYLADKHGVICPRTNSATIYTIPFIKLESFELTPEKSYEAFKKVSSLLPRYNVMPTGVGFAMLIKRQLIDEYKLFDEIYSPGYCEENDFCMRINEHGYSCIAANRAFIYHYESKSFGNKRNELDLQHSIHLLKRYPHYHDTVEEYIERLIDPIEYFADLIGEIYDKKRILIDVYEILEMKSELAKDSIELLEELYKKLGEKYEITILVNEAVDKIYGISKRFKNVQRPELISVSFDLVIALAAITKTEHWHFINRNALKYVMYMNGIDCLRSNKMRSKDFERWSIFEKAIWYADGVIFCRCEDKEDLKTYFSRVFETHEISTYTIDEDCVSDFATIIQDVLQRDLNIGRLYTRWHSVNYEMDIHKSYVTGVNNIKKQVKKGFKKNLRRYPVIYNTLKRAKLNSKK